MAKERASRTKNPVDREKIRLTIDVTPEFYERLEKLEERTYLANKATVIRHALTLFEYFVSLAEEGGEVVIRKPDGAERSLDRLAFAVAG